MSLPVFKALKRLAMGDSIFPQQVMAGMRAPQCEIALWLHGMGNRRLVTNRHVMACVGPLMIGVGFDPWWFVPPESSAKLRLRFVELRLKAHFAWLRYRGCRFNNNPEIKITPREAHTMIAFFICPRPLMLVSVRNSEQANVFPMNLRGPIGDGKFAFALNSTRHAAPVVVKAGRAVISTVPLTKARLAKALGRNHLKASIDLSDLPFESRLSRAFGLPVPDFAVRVRPLKIESPQRPGSHTFFIARAVHDQRITVAQECFYVHGIYQSWRVRNLAALAAR